VCLLLSALCCMLCAACCVLCAACCVLRAACCVLRAACCVLCAVCCVLCAVCCVLCAVCCVLCAVCCVLPAASVHPAVQVADTKMVGEGSEADSEVLLTNWAALSRPALPASGRLLALLAAYPKAAYVLSPSVLASNFLKREDMIRAVSLGATFVVGSGGDDFDRLAMEQNVREAIGKMGTAVGEAFTWLSDAPMRWTGELDNLSDGSPSTVEEEGDRKGLAVKGTYDGEWDHEAALPNGEGTMSWANGITYSGGWAAGKFEGYGEKLYSRGGGYKGQWSAGKRQGWGMSIYGGKVFIHLWIPP